MAEGYLDIGTLTGAIEMDDRLTSSLELIIHRIDGFAEKFLGEFKGLAYGIASVGTVITGIAATITTLAVKGSEVSDVTEGFERLAKGAQNAEEILKAMREGVVGTIPDLRLMQDANRLLGAGVSANAEDFKTLTTAAHVLANEGYGNIESVLGTLNRAMTTGSTFRIKQLGVIIDSTKAEREYANSIGVSASQLTRDQQLLAVRTALIEALGKRVAAAGQLHLSFAEKFEAALTAIKNWSERLELAIARSPAVNKAFDDIGNAIRQAFGGDGQSLIESLVKWVERFASAVSTFAPPIIKLFGGIYDVLQTIFDAVEAAWDSLPDWLKTVIKDAAVASIAIWGIQKALEATIATALKGKGANILGGGGGGGGGIGIEGVASGATIASGTIDSFKALRSVVTSLPGAFAATSEKVTGLFGIFGKFGPVATTFGKAAIAMGASGEAVSGVTAAMTTATIASGPLIVAIAGTAAAAAIGWRAWQLWAEHSERAAAQARQNTIDESNLARINKTLGTSYTDLDEAVKAANKHAEELRKNTELQNSGAARQAAFAEAHKKEIENLTQSFVDQANKVNFTKEAFQDFTDRLHDNNAAVRQQAQAQLLNRNVQDAFIKAFEEQRAAHIELNTEQQKAYEAWTRDRAATLSDAVARLANEDAIKKQVAALREQGNTEAEVAEAMHMTVAQLREAQKPLLERIATLQRENLSEEAINERLHLNAEQRAVVTEAIKRQQAAQDALTTSLDNHNLAMSHGSFDAWKTSQDHKMEREIRDLRQSKDWTQATEDAKRAEYQRTAEEKQMQDEEAFDGSKAQAIAARDQAKNTLEMMLRDTTGFHASDIRAARDAYNEKARAAEHWSATATKAEEEAAAAAVKANEEAAAATKKRFDDSEEWASHWHNMQVTMTREEAEATVKNARRSGDMWQEFFIRIAESSLKLLDEAQLKQDMAQFKTREELKKTADQAKKTFDAMKSSGLYTADVLQQAWKKYTDAQQAALGITEEAARAQTNTQASRNIALHFAPAMKDVGTFGRKPRPTANELRWGSEPGATAGRIAPVTFAPGSVVVQYPIMNDPRAKNEIARLVGDAFVANMQSKGQRT